MKILKSYAAIISLVLLQNFTGFYCVAQVTDTNKADCKICDRLLLFNTIKVQVASKYWPDFDKGKQAPMLYTTPQNSFVAFSQNFPLKHHAYQKLNCDNGLTIYKTSRIGPLAFYMQNKLDFNDTASSYYFRPMMVCSDVETTLKQIVDFKTTEEWIQLVMHEYFHSYQFSSKYFLRYFAENISIKEDSLNVLYAKNKWFSDIVKKENDCLLSIISGHNTDSIKMAMHHFVALRHQRRKRFKIEFGYDISAIEDFWEKVEGTARYVEYYTGLSYSRIKTDVDMSCDPKFKNFAAFRSTLNLENESNFYIRTQIMKAYYYVTGFNMCRVLDKLKVPYKPTLFNEKNKSLFAIVEKTQGS